MGSKYAKKNYYLVKNSNDKTISKHYSLAIARKVIVDAWRKKNLTYHIVNQDNRHYY